MILFLKIGLNLTTVAERTGTYRCFVPSTGAETFQEYIVTDVPESVLQHGLGIVVEHRPETRQVLEGDFVELQCRAQKYAYGRMYWERLLDGPGQQFPQKLDNSTPNANFRFFFSKNFAVDLKCRRKQKLANCIN